MLFSLLRQRSFASDSFVDNLSNLDHTFILFCFLVLAFSFALLGRGLDFGRGRFIMQFVRAWTNEQMVCLIVCFLGPSSLPSGIIATVTGRTLPLLAVVELVTQQPKSTQSGQTVDDESMASIGSLGTEEARHTATAVGEDLSTLQFTAVNAFATDGTCVTSIAASSEFHSASFSLGHKSQPRLAFKNTSALDSLQPAASDAQTVATDQPSAYPCESTHAPSTTHSLNSLESAC